MIYFLLAAAVVLSLIGLAQNRWEALRLAVALGWLGPLPAFLYAVWAQHPPFHGPLDFLRQSLPTYATFVVPTFGSYCFVLGLAGGLVLERLGKTARPVAVAGLCAVAAVPFILWGGSVSSGFGLWALIAAGFWAVLLGAYSAVRGARRA